MIAVRWTVRIIMILVWLGVIFGFLFLPKIPLLKPVQRETINVYSWTEVIDIHKVVEFERKTGIKVNIGFYESNEELFAKLKLTGGTGYDLIIPSDYMVELFIKEGLLQKLDHTKLNFLPRLSTALTGHYYDPHNDYSVPYLWSLYGIGIDKHFFGNKTIKPSWAVLFDPAITQAPRVMIEDARELILLTAFYLFKKIEGLDAAQITAIKNLLIRQKPFVMAYTDVGVPYMLSSEQCPLALAASPYVLRLIPTHPHIDFLVPDEGTFVIIDNMVIPAASKKQELVYKFINFFYEKEVVQYHVDKTYFFPPTTDITCKELPVSSQHIFASCGQQVTKFQFFRNVINERVVNNVWIALKSS